MKTEKQLERLAMRLVTKVPPVKWPEVASKLNEQELMTLVRKLDGIVTTSTMAATYMNARSKNLSPRHSIAEMNRKTRAIRKTLGYQITTDLTI